MKPKLHLSMSASMNELYSFSYYIANHYKPSVNLFVKITLIIGPTLTRSGTGGSLERCSRKPIRRGAMSNAAKVSNEGVDNLAAIDVNEAGRNSKEIEGKT